MKKQDNVIPFDIAKANHLKKQHEQKYSAALATLTEIVIQTGRAYGIDTKDVLSDLTYLVVSRDILEHDPPI